MRASPFWLSTPERDDEVFLLLVGHRWTDIAVSVWIHNLVRFVGAECNLGFWTSCGSLLMVGFWCVLPTVTQNSMILASERNLNFPLSAPQRTTAWTAANGQNSRKRSCRCVWFVVTFQVAFWRACFKFVHRSSVYVRMPKRYMICNNHQCLKSAEWYTNVHFLFFLLGFSDQITDTFITPQGQFIVQPAITTQPHHQRYQSLTGNAIQGTELLKTPEATATNKSTRPACWRIVSDTKRTNFNSLDRDGLEQTA